MKTLLVMLALAVLVGCDDARQIQVNSDVPGFTVSEKNERPEFKRIYESEFTARGTDFHLTVEGWCFWFDRSCTRDITAMLVQQGGLVSSAKYVSFDPENPADKIFDREILPTVEDLCRRAVAADKAYWKSDPKEFTDVGGNVWKK